MIEKPGPSDVKPLVLPWRQERFQVLERFREPSSSLPPPLIGDAVPGLPYHLHISYCHSPESFRKYLLVFPLIPTLSRDIPSPPYSTLSCLSFPALPWLTREQPYQSPAPPSAASPPSSSRRGLSNSISSSTPPQGLQKMALACPSWSSSELLAVSTHWPLSDGF